MKPDGSYTVNAIGKEKAGYTGRRASSDKYKGEPF